jgi:hypothetical protein
VAAHVVVIGLLLIMPLLYFTDQLPKTPLVAGSCCSW